jgi:hypothetical protein
LSATTAASIARASPASPGSGGSAHLHHQRHARRLERIAQGFRKNDGLFGEHCLEAASHVHAMVGVADGGIECRQFIRRRDDPNRNRVEQPLEG